MSRRMELQIDDDLYYYFLYQKSREISQIGITVQQMIRNLIVEHVKDHPADKIRLHNFLESKGLENQEMKEKRLFKEAEQKKEDDDIF